MLSKVVSTLICVLFVVSLAGCGQSSFTGAQRPAAKKSSENAPARVASQPANDTDLPARHAPVRHATVKHVNAEPPADANRDRTWLAPQVEDLHTVQRMLLVEKSEVQEALGLSEQQKAAFKKLAGEARSFLLRNAHRITGDMYRDPATRDEMRPLAQKWDQRLRALLEPGQFAEVDRRAFREQAGASVLLHPEVRRQLQLSEKQLQQVEALAADARREVAAMSMWQRLSGGAEVGQRARRRAFQLLNTRQHAAWDEWVGNEAE